MDSQLVGTIVGVGVAMGSIVGVYVRLSSRVASVQAVQRGQAERLRDQSGAIESLRRDHSGAIEALRAGQADMGEMLGEMRGTLQALTREMTEAKAAFGGMTTRIDGMRDVVEEGRRELREIVTEALRTRRN